MTTNNVQQRIDVTEPTDLSALNNLNAVTTSGFGGPHQVFDINNYKSHLRLPTRLIEFNASHGAIVGVGYVWAINVIDYNDNFESSIIKLPSTDLDITKFVNDQMVRFINKYNPDVLYFHASRYKIETENFVKGQFNV